MENTQPTINATGLAWINATARHAAPAIEKTPDQYFQSFPSRAKSEIQRPKKRSHDSSGSLSIRASTSDIATTAALGNMFHVLYMP